MPKKQTILVVDDELVNREILGATLEDDYRVLYATNGQEALDLLEKGSDVISLILLDLLMPVMSGMTVLRQLRESPELTRIPVIVMTSDHEAEVASLELGAFDFIPKPYPSRSVILARIRRIIELSEDRQIIRSTERDVLTGLYNREYFYNYIASFDKHHKGMDMDAIVVDIYRFHIINERYGRASADQLLRRLGNALHTLALASGGMACRREADTFLLYRGVRRQAAQGGAVRRTADGGFRPGHQRGPVQGILPAQIRHPPRHADTCKRRGADSLAAPQAGAGQSRGIHPPV